MNTFRRVDDTITILALNSIQYNKQLADLLKGSCVIDGVIPTPFHEKKLYKFLYRILKRITHIKELEAYVYFLEQELCIESQENHNTSKPQKTSKEKSTDNSREKDIRFSSIEKISATEFIASFDDTIIDKMELLFEQLDDFIITIYDFENHDTKQAFQLIPAFSKQINEVWILIDSLSVFSVVARAFHSLNDLLDSLTPEDLADESKKNMFALMLLSIVKDLEKWINVIFIEQSTDDIHYFDASFSSNILELEKIFEEEQDEDEVYDEDEDDDDLEFF